MRIDCDILNRLHEKKNNDTKNKTILIGVSLRCLEFGVLRSPEDLSMMFQLESVDDVSKWKKYIDDKGVSGIEEIVHGYRDDAYNSWNRDIVNDASAPTYWIYNAKKALNKNIPDGYERLILPFMRMLSQNLSVYQLSDIFCLNTTQVKTWKTVGIEELKKFLLAE